VRRTGERAYDPDLSRRWVPERSIKRAREVLAQRFAALADAPLSETRACHYESSGTGNFIIDRHPDFDNLWFAGGGNAEGFKFGPVIGDYVAGRIRGKSDPELDEQFVIPEELPEEPPGDE
jgi:glycine/D-amino acid oxidase-like deaminating enzyme